MPLGTRQVKQKKPLKQVKGVATANTENFFDAPLQYNIPKGVEDDKKVKPAVVFEGYTSSSSKKKTSSKQSKKKSK